MALVEMHEVVKRFGSTTVLDHVDLTVEEHEVVCLIGASGSGKSTLLRCVNGLEPINAGAITVGGRRVIQDDIKLNRLAARRRHRVPGVQPVPAHDGARQRDPRAPQSASTLQE